MQLSHRRTVHVFEQQNLEEKNDLNGPTGTADFLPP